MAMIPSERFVFPDLTVLDNLLLGAANEPDADRRGERMEQVHDLFPILVERSQQLAGTMSGGQQRMVSLGMALMASPKLLMLDEPSLGLAPAVVQQIFDTVRHLADDGGPRRAPARAERRPGAADRRPGLRDALRPGHPRGDRRADARPPSYWDLF